MKSIVVYIYGMGHYSVIRKNEILALVTVWMDLEGITLSEVSEKDNYPIASFIHKIKKMEFM